MKIEFILPKVKSFDNKEMRRSIGLEHPPQPAKNFISEEYKNLINYEDSDLRKPTVKKCMPFLDAMASGYIIPFFQDYLITMDYEKKEWDVRTNFYSPQVHSSQQLPKNYQDGVKPIGKFANKWIIKTPPGYSCLFVHPMNTPKTDFEIISGVVDTDTYEDTVLFPYYFKRYDDNKKKVQQVPLELGEKVQQVPLELETSSRVQVHLELGTPMVQVIPFKRENWKSESKVKVEENIGKWRNNWAGRLIDSYKKLYWQKKHYE
jgi:hypothetical protein